MKTLLVQEEVAPLILPKKVMKQQQVRFWYTYVWNGELYLVGKRNTQVREKNLLKGFRNAGGEANIPEIQARTG